MGNATPEPRLRALTRADLDRLEREGAVARLAPELPSLRAPLSALRERCRETGLLGPLSSLYAVEASGAEFVAEAWAPDTPAVATTLRVGLAPFVPGAPPGAATAAALGRVVAHLFRTTAVVRVERATAADDRAARDACERAGLRLEGVRRAAGLVGGRPADIAVYASVRGRAAANTSGSTSAMGTNDPIRRIAVLTGGGDAPGLNAVIRAVVKTAVRMHGWEVYGVEDGFEGLLGRPLVRPLAPDDVRGLLPRGGTILGTSNKGNFTRGAGIPSAPLEEAVAALARLGVDALVTIGGDGTQTIAAAFAERGVRVVGVPKTIDNDLEGTDLTFGFNSALEMATDAIDRLHTTAESHDRVMVLEVMGRTAGWIALHAAIAGGADAVLIPEIPFSVERVAEAVLARERAGRRFSIVVAAEGAAPEGGRAVLAAEATATESARFGGVGHEVGRRLGELTGKDTRVAVLGHLQRGGQPTAFDRLLATEFGASAVRALARGESGRVVALHGVTVTTVPIAEVAGRCRVVPRSSPLLRTAAELGIEIGADPAVALDLD